MIAVIQAQAREVARRCWPGEPHRLWSLQSFIHQLEWTLQHRDILRDRLKGTKEEIEADISALNSDCDLLLASGFKPCHLRSVNRLFRAAYTGMRGALAGDCGSMVCS